MTDTKKDTQFAENQDNINNELENCSNAGIDCGTQDCDNLAEENQQGSDTPANMADGNGEADNDWKDKYMRLSAEFDNYRKRTLKEKMDLVSYGGEDVIKSLLPILDDMDRALDNMLKTDDIESVRTGIELISAKLVDTLKTKGVKEIEALGSELDTDYHEAIAKTPAPDKSQKGKIVDVVQKGYMLKDKVVRHSKVVVGE